MNNRHPFLVNSIIIALLTLLLDACNLPQKTPGINPPAVPDTMGTAVVETFIAQTVVAAQANPPGQSTPTLLSVTSTPQPPTDIPIDTPTITLSPTVTLTLKPSNTPTPETPMVSVSAVTYCRAGPGKVYDLLGTLLVGEKTEVIARDPISQSWYVRNPDNPGQFCWLWGKYATTNGNVESLPVFTPPPTPSPTPSPTPALDFSIAFHEVDSCGVWFLEFTLHNNGDIIFQSYSVTVTDNNTSERQSLNMEVFEDWNGCLVATSFDDLIPGDTLYVLSSPLNANPTGHSISATFTLCSQPGLGGVCLSKDFNFTP